MELNQIFFVCISVIILSTAASSQKTKGNWEKCELQSTATDSVTEPLCFSKLCLNHMEKQINKELEAAFTYLQMATYFDQESVNRPGLAKFLYEAASEEREHAILMINYITMRGIPLKRDTFDQFILNGRSSIGYRAALAEALKKEVEVTEKIHIIIKHCHTDFHGADVFTDPILAEQHASIHKLQGLLKTYDDMTLGLKECQLKFAEYLFDQKFAA